MNRDATCGRETLHSGSRTCSPGKASNATSAVNQITCLVPPHPRLKHFASSPAARSRHVPFQVASMSTFRISVEVASKSKACGMSASFLAGVADEGGEILEFFGGQVVGRIAQVHRDRLFERAAE